MRSVPSSNSTKTERSASRPARAPGHTRAGSASNLGSSAVPRSVTALGSGPAAVGQSPALALAPAPAHALAPIARATRRAAAHRPSGDFVQAVKDGAVQDAQHQLERRIRAHLPKGSLAVTLTDNHYTMISVRRDRREGPHYRVRLHHMFASASPPITRALAKYIARNDRRASNLLGDYIDANQHRVRARNRRVARTRLVSQGDHLDLAEIYDDVNQRYFGGHIEARITWGQRTSKPRRRNSIKMGSYAVEDKLIRIHRALDREFVPRFFVEWIVYHEMLHQVHPIHVVNGRRQFHTREFLEDEAAFEHYAEARQWERAHLDELLTY